MFKKSLFFSVATYICSLAARWILKKNSRWIPGITRRASFVKVSALMIRFAPQNRSFFLQYPYFEFSCVMFDGANKYMDLVYRGVPYPQYISILKRITSNWKMGKIDLVCPPNPVPFFSWLQPPHSIKSGAATAWTFSKWLPALCYL